MSDDLLFGEPGKREERVEWGRRYVTDCVFGRKGDVDLSTSEEHAKRLGGRFYEGGPVRTEPVRRTVVTYTTTWERA